MGTDFDMPHLMDSGIMLSNFLGRERKETGKGTPIFCKIKGGELFHHSIHYFT
jgi:hypothetical protein